MMDSLLNLLFRCSHRRLTRPVAPITKAGEPHSQSYVVCLDCGKQVEYDLQEMRMGKAINHSHDAGVRAYHLDVATPRQEACLRCATRGCGGANIVHAIVSARRPGRDATVGMRGPRSPDVVAVLGREPCG